MKQSRTIGNKKPKLQPRRKWQTGEYSRHAEFRFVLPQPFLILCRLTDTSPEEIIRDFINNLSCGSWQRDGRDEAKQHLFSYFIAHGYGDGHYSETDIRSMFQELDTLGSLFPVGGRIKLIDLYTKWRNRHLDHFFKKWFFRIRRKVR
ncbi:MAG: hypothetical protein EOO09_08140 [Chitinophagaceae bacterium]|nr:MAG: hypothetical protein EOO09_08140 [Chitinophagaceae bacterium]